MISIYKFLFCCLNSKKTKNIEYFLLLVNFLCFIFYILFFSTMSWSFIPILYKFLFYINLCFLFISISLNIYFIYIRGKKLINTKMNTIALSLAILIVLISILSILINITSSYNIFSQIKNLNNQKIIFYKSKKDNVLSILSIIAIDLIWVLILFFWFADLIRIKIKIEDTFYNYLKIKSFRKNFYLFKEEYNKESNEQLHNVKINDTNIKKKDITPLKFSTNIKLIEDNNNISNISNLNINNNPNNLNISNSSNHNHSHASSSLSDSYQKPVNMIIIGTDEKGFPIYEKQNSFDKSQISNESDSFSNRDKKFNHSYYIKFNDISLNAEENIHDIENPNLEKNLILEKEIEDNDEIKPKLIEKINPNENENENENENNDYKENFMPLQNREIDKDSENKDFDEQKSKINE